MENREEEQKDEIEKYWRVVKENPQDFNSWEHLIALCESENNPENLRKSYEEFLMRFPLCYGYWKKYADHELKTSVEQAKEVYEKAVEACSASIEIWQCYVDFMMTNTKNTEETRSVLMRSLEKIGLNFVSHSLWDKAIEFEESHSEYERAFHLLERVIAIPLQQYARFFDKYTQYTATKTASAFFTTEEYQTLESQTRKEVIESGDSEILASESKREDAIKKRLKDFGMRKKIELNKKIEDESRKRWAYEEAIVRPYFHVKAMDEPGLINWRNYLEFEEKEGVHDRIIHLYERCLIPCALYEEMWIKFSRYLASKGLISHAHQVFQKSLSGFLSRKPSLHIAYSHFLEEFVSAQQAQSVLTAAHSTFPGHLEIIISLASFHRRNGKIEDAKKAYEEGLKIVDDTFTPYLTCHFSNFLLNNNEVDKARRILLTASQSYRDSKIIYSSLLSLEKSQKDADRVKNVLSVFELVKESSLSDDDKFEFGQQNIEFILDNSPSISGLNKIMMRCNSYSKSRKRGAEDDLQYANKMSRQEPYQQWNYPNYGGYPSQTWQGYPPFPPVQGASMNQEWPQWQ